jgi:hypothetical protein
MHISVRALEKIGFLCALFYAAWLNFIDPILAYLAGDGSLSALIVSVSAGLLGTACAVHLAWAGLRRTGCGSCDPEQKLEVVSGPELISSFQDVSGTEEPERTCAPV